MRNRKQKIVDIIAAVRAFDDGMPGDAVCARWGISLATLYEWRRLYRDVPLPAAARLEQLARENAELKRRISRCDLDCRILQAALRGQELNVDERYSLTASLLKKFRISVTRACKLVGISRTQFLYRSPPNRDG